MLFGEGAQACSGRYFPIHAPRNEKTEERYRDIGESEDGHVEEILFRVEENVCRRRLGYVVRATLITGWISEDVLCNGTLH